MLGVTDQSFIPGVGTYQISGNLNDPTQRLRMKSFGTAREVPLLLSRKWKLEGSLERSNITQKYRPQGLINRNPKEIVELLHLILAYRSTTCRRLLRYRQ
jgi:hypothetical protein